MIREVVDSSASMLKLTLLHKVEFFIPVWSKEITEQFLVHFQRALDTISQKGLSQLMRRLKRTRRSVLRSLPMPLRL